MTKKQEETIITILSAAAIMLALLLSSRLWFRLDLTAGKIYTISPVSRNLAKEIPDQVKISYFLSGKLQQLYPEPDEIADLIREYAAYSRGKISFTLRDPAKEGVEEDIQRLGVYPRQIQSIDRNEATVTSVYSGLLIEYMEKSDVIPFVFSLETLEYDLTSRIRSLVSGKAREAGVLITDLSKPLGQNYRNMSEILRMSGYKLREIYMDELSNSEIPDDLSEIIVIGGIDAPEEEVLYSIDRYIRRGGKAMFMIGAFSSSTGTGVPEMRPLEDGGLAAMLRSYGVELQQALVLDNSCLTITYQSMGTRGIPSIRLIRYPFWLSVTRAGGNPAHPVTSSFAGVDMFWPNPLTLRETEGITAEALVYSTEDAWLMTKDFSVNPDSAFMFTREAGETTGKKLLGAALTGKFPSYSGEGAASEAAESRIVVIGNSEFLNDSYLDSDRNLAFFLSAADWLANDDDIIGIRSRAGGISRLDKIRSPESRNAAMTFARFLNTALIPAAVFAFAVVFTFKRRKNTKKAFSGGQVTSDASAASKDLS